MLLFAAAWVRLKWKNLRDTYCRILKYKNKAEKGSRRKKWVFEDHLSFLKFPYVFYCMIIISNEDIIYLTSVFLRRYEPDYQPQCVELSDDYIEDINSGGVTSDDLLEQLDDRNDEDYSEYLEVLEETTADPVLAVESHTLQVLESSPQQITDNSIAGHQNSPQDIDAYAQQIQAKYRKIRPKKIKYDNSEYNTDDTDLSNNYGILSPNFKIEQLKLPGSNSVSVNPIIVTNTATSSPLNTTASQESSVETKIHDQAFLAPIGKTSIELFFNSMAQTVKLLPPKAQAEIKMSVCRIVTEAEVIYSKNKITKHNTQQFIAPPGMIPKLVLIPCNMIDNPENK